MVELDNVDDVDDTLDADNLDLEKKNIGSLAQTNMFPKGHKLTFGKRTNIDESDATDDGKYLLKKKQNKINIDNQKAAKRTCLH